MAIVEIEIEVSVYLQQSKKPLRQQDFYRARPLRFRLVIRVINRMTGCNNQLIKRFFRGFRLYRDRFRLNVNFYFGIGLRR